MKPTHILILILLIATATSAQTNSIVPRVDERTELLSIVFRHANADEYVNNQLVTYAKETDEYFAPFKNHELIKFAVNLRKTKGVSFDAVMSMAIHLELGEAIKFKQNITTQSMDKRWGQENIPRFVDLLNQFYTKSKFHSFFTAHQTLYQAAENNFASILSQVDFTWFNSFYGVQSNGDFHLLIGLLNGGGNYGPKVQFQDGKEEIYAIIGTSQVDSIGNPTYSKGMVPIIIHEYNHSFCNPLIERNLPKMKRQAAKLYKQSDDKLKQQAYGSPQTMLYEILVRACVIVYFQQHGTADERIKSMIMNDKSKGFLWIDDLVNALKEYQENRNKYPTLQDFMPKIVNLQNSTSLAKLKTEYLDKCVQISSISIKNKAKNINPGITGITINFDRPMNTSAKGLANGNKGKAYFPPMPQGVKSKWDTITNMKWTFPVTLKPDTEYSISFPAQFFVDQMGFPLNKTYYLDFKTRK